MLVTFNMNANKNVRLTIASPEVEVKTSRRADGKYETILNGGRLDGERFVSRDPRQHGWAVRFARSSAKSRTAQSVRV